MALTEAQIQILRETFAPDVAKKREYLENYQTRK
jgi:hypothetical protein